MESLKTEAAWLKQLPLRDMVRFGWISAHSDTGRMQREGMVP
jgi:hypothetical protein